MYLSPGTSHTLDVLYGVTTPEVVPLGVRTCPDGSVHCSAELEDWTTSGVANSRAKKRQPKNLRRIRLGVKCFVAIV